MALFNDIYCQTCDKFITKEQWNKHLYSSRHLHREVNGYWPAIFQQRKLTRDEGSILEKAFWEIIFGSEDVLAVYRFLKTYITMATKLNEHVKGNDGDDKVDFDSYYRDNMIAQFKQDSYDKNFSLQNQGKCNENDTLQKRIKFWLNVIDMWGQIPDNVYEYDYNDPGKNYYLGSLERYPELRDLKKVLINDSQIN